MGELPPLHTPQGPGVPRASWPGFPRVDSSGTSSAPSSRSASFPFLASGSLHGPIQLPPRISPPSSTRVSLRFLPVPSPSLRPVPVGLSTSFLTPLPGSFSSPFHAYLLGIVLCLGCVFPPKGSVTFSSASSSVSSSFLPLPSPSFRPVLPSSLHSRPLRFSRRLPAHMAFRLFPRSPSGSRVPPPLSRGSVSVARRSRRSAPTPLQRSGKVDRDGGDT